MLHHQHTSNIMGKTGMSGRLISSFALLLLCFNQSAIADYKDDIGFTALQAQLGGNVPTGISVPVMHVEAAVSYFDHDGNPLTPSIPVYLPDDTNTQFSTKTITDKSNLTTRSYSGHATSVGTYIYGNTSSIAAGITTINAYLSDGWLLGDYLQFGGNKPLKTPDRVSNSSWIGTLASADAELLRRSDWVVDNDEMVMCVGVKNSSSQNSSLLSGAFNVIAIGKSDGLNGYGTNQLDGDYVSGRVRPEIVVPLNTSSAATGLTSSAVSLLIETSQSNPDLVNDPVETSTTNRNGDTIYNTERSEVIKSVLMAGAERITSNTTGNDITDYRANVANQTSNGLDIRYGAGQLNILNSYNIIIAGEQNSDEDDGDGSGSIADMGFDYDPSFGGGSSSNITASYYFNTNRGGSFLSTTLAWNININGGNDPSFSGTAEFYDLDLTLYDVTNGQVLIVDSSSTINNSESIWTDLPKNKNYLLQVTVKSGQSQFKWDYALAWRLALVVDSDLDSIGDDADNCPAVANASQTDTDADGRGDACDSDDDNDGLSDVAEAAAGTNPLLADTDNDGVNDNVDVFPLDGSEWLDSDGDGTGNNADIDDDNDGVLDQVDAFPLDSTRSVADSGVVSASESGGGGGSVSLLGLCLFSLLGFARRKTYS